MAFTIDFDDGDAVEWHAVADGLTTRRNDTYTPTIYVNSAADSALADLAETLAVRGDVADTAWEQWRPAFRRSPERVLRVDVTDIDRVQPLAGWIRRRGRPGTYRLFNVDFSPQFRYCLETDTDPVPDRSLRVLELTDPTPGGPDPPLDTLDIDGERIDGGPRAVLSELTSSLDEIDPDVLVCSTAALVPALFETAERLDRAVALGRRPGYEQLASASSYESYGEVGHSPARYTVPGRAIIDRSNTFFYRETNLDGCLDLVERSHKPLQELAWASIGNVLTAIQIREARRRGVLVPWQSYRHEFPKTARQLHEADRGGFTFAPEVGVHEDVHELDFASLYPNIICTRNVSPETIRCDCHDRADVPGLGYSICSEAGYLPDVLRPIIADRSRIKTELDTATEPDRVARLEGKSSALKWILVSCFGYQGFSNAKFGRIECHEAINAYAREILLDAKATLEDAGWRVLHGIVDSLWVTARDGESQEPLDSVAARVTDETDIELEHEAAYDWLAFVPLRDSDRGALTSYFGKRRDGSTKYRGIECRQRSTSAFVTDCQHALIEAFDRTREPAAVCAELVGWLGRLERGDVDPAQLTITRRVSKRREAYDGRTRTTATLARRADRGVDTAPGQDIKYVVADDSKSGRERVRLPPELTGSAADYDTAFYRTRLLRAAESVISPVGWRREDIEGWLADRSDRSLGSFA